MYKPTLDLSEIRIFQKIPSLRVLLVFQIKFLVDYSLNPLCSAVSLQQSLLYLTLSFYCAVKFVTATKAYTHVRYVYV